MEQKVCEVDLKVSDRLMSSTFALSFLAVDQLDNAGEPSN